MFETRYQPVLSGCRATSTVTVSDWSISALKADLLRINNKRVYTGVE